MLRNTVFAATFMAGCVAVGYAVVYALFGTHLLGLLTNIPELLTLAGGFLPWMAVSPLLSVWSYQLDGIFIGATRSTEMRNAMILSVAIFLAAEVTMIRVWDNHGLWAAMMLFMCLRAATLGYHYPALQRAAAG